MAQNAEFKSSLGLFDGTMLVAGSMIGSGIFIVSADIVRNTGGAGWLMLVWLITGIMTLTAALSYGELSAMYPKAGGQYVYLKEAYNPLVSFTYGWSLFMVIQTATIAAVGVAFAKFTAYIIPFFSEENILLAIGSIQISAAQMLAIGSLLILTYLNAQGVKNGKLIQAVFTVTKLLSLLGLIVFGFWAYDAAIWDANWNSDMTWEIHGLSNDGNVMDYLPLAATGAIAAAMVGSIFSSDAWNNVTFIAGEIENPKRNVGLSLAFGTLIVTAIYLSANLMYTAVLPMEEIAFAKNDRVAVVVSQSIFGSIGTTIIALMIMVATFGCNNGLIMSGARVYYSMAKDGLFFRKVGELNGNNVPAFGLWIQFIVASFWCLSGKYGDLLDMISFVVVLFYMLTIGGIFILRVKQPNHPRPYRAFGYPVLPILYLILGALFCLALAYYKPKFTWPGLLIALAGIPIYWLFAKKNIKEE